MKQLYNEKPWAKLVKRMGIIPENTESQARRVAENAAVYIEDLEREIQTLYLRVEEERYK